MEPLVILAALVAIAVLVVTFLGVRLSWPRWLVLGFVLLLVAPAMAVAYHEVFTNVDYLPV